MELTEDLVAIQGILISVIKVTGEFTKINHKGGNEEKIIKIIEDIQRHIKSKNYIKDGKINRVFDKQMEEIVMFLALNTKYNKTLELADYEHLIDIMPQLSKCVLATVVYGLDLCKYYCRVIEKLPLSYGIELLEEMVPNLKKSIPNIQLKYAIMFLRSTAIKLSSEEITKKDEDNIYKISELADIILQFLTGLNSGHVKNLKAAQIYQHMGYTLLHLFELLLFCNKDNPNLRKFIDNVLKTCCAIIKNVTINVFCCWAEITEGDEPLQSLVSGKAYEVVEEYQKYKEAKELISMLGAIAKKPKTLSERIQTADTATIIRRANIRNNDQKTWFQALMGTQIFDNKDAISCVNTWAHLCDENDVTRLLSMSCQSKSEDAKKLALKCASTLNLDKLLPVVTRYFYENKFKGHLPNSDKVQTQLNLIFNKVNLSSEVEDNVIKDLSLLLLQSPDTVLKGVFRECLRDSCYSKCYRTFFTSIKEIASISNFGIDCLWEVVNDNRPDFNIVDNYVVLLTTLLQIDFTSNHQVINNLLLRLLDQLQNEKRYEQLGCVLEIFLGCSLSIPACSEMTKVRLALLNTMDDCRCTFLEMNVIKQQTASYAVDVMKRLCEVKPEYDFEEECEAFAGAGKKEDEFFEYYKKYLSSKTDTTFLYTFYSDFSVENHTECVSKLLRFLPRAVTSEWSSILQEIFQICGSKTAMDVLTDVMILLCKVVDSQEASSETGIQINAALKYCLQQYGLALQNIQADSTLEVEVDITKNVCRILRYLPEAIKEDEGMSLINVLTRRSLKSLNDDKEFVCLLISIRNNLIYRSLAQIMTD